MEDRGAASLILAPMGASPHRSLSSSVYPGSTKKTGECSLSNHGVIEGEVKAATRLARPFFCDCYIDRVMLY